MKQVVVVIRRAPLNTALSGEALRMSLGLTLSDHKVTVLYAEEGAYTALGLKPEEIAQPGIKQSLDLFEGMKVRQVVEQDALESWAVPFLRKDIEPIDRRGALDLIRKADVVLSY
jgi:sulfur relay (sulfurtransferase) DsrF/TusC family protein